MRYMKYFVFLLAVVPFLSPDKEQVLETEIIRYEANENVSNNYLASVNIENVKFDFDKMKTTYELHVPYSKSTLGLTYEAEDKNAIVEVVGGEELFVGNNSVAILVTAVDGSVREYDFTIIRSEDNSETDNNENAIINSLKGDDASKITVGVGSEQAIDLSGDVTEALKESKKTLVFEWTDQNGNFVASLTIDGSKVENTADINPNIKGSISSAKLLKAIGSASYMAVSTINTNIPKGSIYKMNVTGTEDIYYLYYYEEDILITKPLRNIDGTIEFEMEGGYDYAILGDSNRIQKEVSGFSWLWPSIIITVLFFIFIVVIRVVMVKSVRASHTKNLEAEDEKDEQMVDKNE